jgi:3'-phosphoadenosine 5'-phosphosulfate (PAPS) 3'-phosphatase
MTVTAHFDPAPYLEICREAADKLLAWRDDPSARAEVPGRPGKIGADIALHEYLCVRLDETDPGVPVISEEDVVHADARPARYWLIDPIDGTASWKGGFPGFVVQIALNPAPIMAITSSRVVRRVSRRTCGACNGGRAGSTVRGPGCSARSAA